MSKKNMCQMAVLWSPVYKDFTKIERIYEFGNAQQELHGAHRWRLFLPLIVA